MLKYGEGRGKKYAAIKHSCNKTACNNRPAYFKKLICRRTNCLVSRDAGGNERSASLTFSPLFPISSSFILSFADFSLRRVLAASRAKKKQRGKVRDSYSCLRRDGAVESLLWLIYAIINLFANVV